jgi:hypothetical protein
LEVKIVPEKWKGRRNVDKCLALPIPNIGIREAGGIWLTLKMNNSLTTTKKTIFDTDLTQDKFH